MKHIAKLTVMKAQDDTCGLQDIIDEIIAAIEDFLKKDDE